MQMVYGSFDMDWLQEVLAIRPIFNCDEIYWSQEVNEVLARETEADLMQLSLLVLDSLEAHFSGDWGEIGSELKRENDESLKGYFDNDKSGVLISLHSDEKYSLIVKTFNEFSETKIMFKSEYGEAPLV